MEHNSAIRTYMAIMAERDAAVRERNVALDERRRAFAERDMAMLQRDAAIAERNTAMEDRDKALHALQVEDNTIYDNEMPHNYKISQMSEHGYDPSQIPTNSQNEHAAREDVKPRKADLVKEAKEGASLTKMDESSKISKQGSEGMSRQVNVGPSKAWGSDALNMMM